MKWLLAIPALYLIVGVVIAVKYTRETLKGIPDLARSDTYKLGQRISAYVFFPVMIFVWPLYFVPDKWVGGGQ